MRAEIIWDIFIETSKIYDKEKTELKLYEYFLKSLSKCSIKM